MEKTSNLEIDLPSIDDLPAGQAIPVQINAVVTELGILELWMKHTKSDRRWKIGFQVGTEYPEPFTSPSRRVTRQMRRAPSRHGRA